MVDCYKRTLVPTEGAEVLGPRPEGDSQFDINVIFTTDQGTLAALKTASVLARSLEARIRLLVTRRVPYAFPLDRPPVSIAFIEQRCCTLAVSCVEVSEVSVEIFLCRDARAVLLRALRSHSVVVIGGRKRWWPTPEQKLARMFQLRGYQVLFIPETGISRAGPIAGGGFICDPARLAGRSSSLLPPGGTSLLENASCQTERDNPVSRHSRWHRSKPAVVERRNTSAADRRDTENSSRLTMLRSVLRSFSRSLSRVPHMRSEPDLPARRPVDKRLRQGMRFSQNRGE